MRHHYASALAGRTGVGLKPQHYRTIIETSPPIGFFEVHAENYMGEGGPPHRWLEQIRNRYPLSLHGVGLSIGGRQPLDRAHIGRLKSLLDRYSPQLFSEHLAWSSHEGVFFNDLLPLPYTLPTLRRVAEHIHQIQDTLGDACCWRPVILRELRREYSFGDRLHKRSTEANRLWPVTRCEQRCRRLGQPGMGSLSCTFALSFRPNRRNPSRGAQREVGEQEIRC